MLRKYFRRVLLISDGSTWDFIWECHRAGIPPGRLSMLPIGGKFRQFLQPWGRSVNYRYTQRCWVVLPRDMWCNASVLLFTRDTPKMNWYHINIYHVYHEFAVSSSRSVTLLIPSHNPYSPDSECVSSSLICGLALQLLKDFGL